ncbi:MAG TPA: hypothetical protein VMG12_15060 [Polyangiaceae bacterium]|nr:hypothetical protein [Polyangiaceae bacterium]
MAVQEPEPRPPIGVAIDADLSTRADALLALAGLNGLTAKGETRRIALSVSRPSLTAARLADVVAEYYPTLPVGAGFLTIGMQDGAVPRDDAPALARVLATKTPDGAATFETRVQRVLDTADSATLQRNLLLAQHDGNAILLAAGPLTGLARLLALYGARAQIEAKVKLLVVAAGAYPAGDADAAIARDVVAARQVFAEWPTPIVAVGSEVGQGVRYPVAKLGEGTASSTNPIAAACRVLAGTAPDLSTTALAGVLHAIRPESGEFALSAPGTISVLDDGRTRFVPGAAGRQRYLMLNPAKRADLLATYVSLVSAEPAARPTRKLPSMVDAGLPPKPGDTAKPAGAAKPGDAAKPGAAPKPGASGGKP